MAWWQAIILGVIEGITEFLPISSTGHLTIAEKLLGMRIDDPSVVAFTAIIQIGAILAAVIYFWSDIWRILQAWWRGLWWKRARRKFDYKYGWAIIIGSIPIAIVGLLFKHEVETVLRRLWFVAFGWKDTLAIGAGQCLSLIPGVSRSGATISVGLFRGFDRVSVTKLSFFLGIPALVAAGLLEVATKYKHISGGVGWTPTIIATVISFGVGYLAVSWLLKFIQSNNFRPFIIYRFVLGLFLLVMLSYGVISHV